MTEQKPADKPEGDAEDTEGQYLYKGGGVAPDEKDGYIFKGGGAVPDEKTEDAK